MPFEQGNKLGGRPAGVAEWRKGPVAQRMNALSKAQLEDVIKDGYFMYRHPQTEAVTYEMVPPKDRIAALKEMLDRTEGKSPQAITGEDGGAIKIDGSEELLRVLERLASGK